MIFSVSIGKDVTTNSPVPLRGDYIDTIRQASEIGYKGLEIHLNKPSELNVEMIRSLCEKYNVKVCSLSTGGRIQLII